MQLQKNTIDGENHGVIELSVGSNQSYIDTALAASNEEDGFICIVGTGLLNDPFAEHEDPSVPNQEFLAVAYKGILINNKLEL